MRSNSEGLRPAAALAIGLLVTGACLVGAAVWLMVARSPEDRGIRAWESADVPPPAGGLSPDGPKSAQAAPTIDALARAAAEGLRAGAAESFGSILPTDSDIEWLVEQLRRDKGPDELARFDADLARQGGVAGLAGETRDRARRELREAREAATAAIAWDRASYAGSETPRSQHRPDRSLEMWSAEFHLQVGDAKFRFAIDKCFRGPRGWVLGANGVDYIGRDGTPEHRGEPGIERTYAVLETLHCEDTVPYSHALAAVVKHRSRGAPAALEHEVEAVAGSLIHPGRFSAASAALVSGGRAARGARDLASGRLETRMPSPYVALANAQARRLGPGEGPTVGARRILLSDAEVQPSWEPCEATLHVTSYRITIAGAPHLLSTYRCDSAVWIATDRSLEVRGRFSGFALLATDRSVTFRSGFAFEAEVSRTGLPVRWVGIANTVDLIDGPGAARLTSDASPELRDAAATLRFSRAPTIVGAANRPPDWFAPVWGTSRAAMVSACVEAERGTNPLPLLVGVFVGAYVVDAIYNFTTDLVDDGNPFNSTGDSFLRPIYLKAARGYAEVAADLGWIERTDVEGWASTGGDLLHLAGGVVASAAAPAAVHDLTVRAAGLGGRARDAVLGLAQVISLGDRVSRSRIMKIDEVSELLHILAQPLPGQPGSVTAPERQVQRPTGAGPGRQVDPPASGGPPDRAASAVEARRQAEVEERERQAAAAAERARAEEAARRQAAAPSRPPRRAMPATSERPTEPGGAAAAPPASSEARDAPRSFQVSVPGAWGQRVRGAPRDTDWQRVAKTPGAVTLDPGREFALDIATDATDAALAGLRELADERQLHAVGLVYGTKATAVGLVHLGALKHVRVVGLTGTTAVSDGVLGALSGIPGLRELNLRECAAITDVGVGALAALRELEELDLGGCPEVTDRGIASLCALSNLRDLDLPGGEGITDASLESISRIGSLKRLSLPPGRTGDAGLQYVARLSGLEVLSVNSAKVTDAGLRQLSALTNLRTLWLPARTPLCAPAFTQEAVDELRQALPNCRIFN